MTGRYARAVDGNHGSIRDTLRKLPGCRVWDSSRWGSGAPDLLVTYRHGFYMLELKDPTQPKSARKLKPMEAQFRDFVSTALGVSYEVVETVEDALRVVGVVT